MKEDKAFPKSGINLSKGKRSKDYKMPTIFRMRKINSEVGKFFCKEPESKYFRLWGLYDLCCN